MKIIIYTKTSCPYCLMAKEYLAERGIPFTEEVYDDDLTRQTMYDDLGLAADQRTVPQIFAVDDMNITRIGGYRDLLPWGDRIAVGNFNEEF